MNNSSLYYSEPVFRPPSEGKYSLLLTVTVGCAYNCTFCYPYKNKQFRIRPFEEILQDIITATRIYGKTVRRIFLLDGNAFIAKPKLLIQIANACYKYHPNLERITAYAHTNDILAKSEEELRAIRKSGITMVYVGLESGDNDVLRRINKKTNAERMIQASHLLHSADITLSGTIILGVTGDNSTESKRHAIKTAELVNKMNPVINRQWFISALTLMIPPNTKIAHDVQNGLFQPLSPEGILHELLIFLEHIDENVHGCIFRSNHASNYIPLKGTLAEDRHKLIQQVHALLDDSKLTEKLKQSYRRL